MTTATTRADAASCCDEVEDVRWGRRRGALPPLRWWWPSLVFSVAAAVLAVVVTVVVVGPGPLDDPSAADQRDGLLLSGPTLPREVAGVVFGARPVVLLFDRTPPSGPAFERWKRSVESGADLVVVTDPRRAAVLADAVGMPTPVDGGLPVGYAVVDPSRTVRYATLDPSYLLNAFEVDVITGAVDDPA